MKLPLRIAGLCGSGTFLLTALPGFYQNVYPTNLSAMMNDSLSSISILETISISLLGSIAAGIIGYVIGDILSRPEGVPKAKPEATPKESDSVAEALPEEVALIQDELSSSALSGGDSEPPTLSDETPETVLEEPIPPNPVTGV